MDMPDHDELRAAADVMRDVDGPTFHNLGGKRHISEREYVAAVTLARAYLVHPPLTRERVAAAVGALFPSGTIVEEYDANADMAYVREWTALIVTVRLCRLLGVEEGE
jgi:hypothetical protein